ncbi:MAG: 50S ribosomal protein L4 [Verrucomicrobiales bacterium]
MKLTVKDIKGNSQGDLELNIPVIEADKGSQAVHDVVVAFMAAQRSGTACTKTMGEVAGTGKKPWRQKGTGRARAGSFASPLWRGGGVVFGPKPRDYTKKVSKKTRQLALLKALNERGSAGDIIVVDDLKLESPKTKGFLSIMSSLSLPAKTLIVADGADQNVTLALRNVSGVELTNSTSLNTYQVLRYDKVLITRASVQTLEQRLNKE